jgi:hypothetical protein
MQRRLLTAVVAGLFALPGLAVAQTREISGRVIRSGGGQPIGEASVTGAQLPLDANRSYRLSSEAGAPPQPVEFVVLEAVPDTADGLAAVLAEKGCNAQLTMLADRLMTSGE